MVIQLYLDPECLQENWREFGHSSQGFLLPCCWLDKNESPSDDIQDSLFDQEISLTNVKSVKEILNSPQWQNFYKSLQSYDTACARCQSKCGKSE